MLVIFIIFFPQSKRPTIYSHKNKHRALCFLFIFSLRKSSQKEIMGLIWITADISWTFHPSNFTAKFIYIFCSCSHITKSWNVLNVLFHTMILLEILPSWYFLSRVAFTPISSLAYIRSLGFIYGNLDCSKKSRIHFWKLKHCGTCKYTRLFPFKVFPIQHVTKGTE